MATRRKGRDPQLVRRIMSSVRSRGTVPERVLASALRTLKKPLRMHASELPGEPDFVFPRERVAVFVDGDFWHGRQWINRGMPSLAAQFRGVRNRSYWVAKITRNAKRDQRVRRHLNRIGWHVVRIWESRLLKAPSTCVDRIRRVLEKAV